MISSEQNSEGRFSVILVGNYPQDGQESMLRFSEVLARELRKKELKVKMIAPSPVLGRMARYLPGVGKWLGYVDKLVLFPRKLREIAVNSGKMAVFHMCDHSNAVYTHAVQGVPHLVTCHDLLAIRSAQGEFPQHRTRITGKIYQKLILRGLERARRVACVSSTTRNDVLRLTKLPEEKVRVVVNGLNRAFSVLPEGEAGQRLVEVAKRNPSWRLKPGFILHVGGNMWYKNRVGVLQIYAALRRMDPGVPQLVMAGKEFTEDMRKYIRADGLEGSVRELTGVSDEDVQTLYSTAGLMLFPSFEEGFGWPIVEAQASGCPVVIFDRDPMADVGGKAAARIQVDSQAMDKGVLSQDAANAGAEAVKRLLAESVEHRQRRVQEGLRNVERFSTEQMINGYIAVYKDLLGIESEPTGLEAPLETRMPDAASFRG